MMTQALGVADEAPMALHGAASREPGRGDR